MNFDFDWWAIIITLLLILFDLVTGIVKALKTQSVSSKIMREGLYHKSAFILIVVLAVICEGALQHVDMALNMPLVVPVCGFIVLTEIASSIENLAVINPELTSSSILKLFENIGDKGDNKNA